MLFFRIVRSGCNINGHYKFRVYGYKPTSWKPEQYNYISVDDMKNLGMGRVYKDNHYILTIWDKVDILKQLEKTFGKDNFVYIYE